MTGLGRRYTAGQTKGAPTMLNGCAYILTVDVGNTFIRFGLFAEDSAAAQECPLATCEITTPSSITADEVSMRLTQVMGALSADAGMPGVLVPAAAVLSCVVPALERRGRRRFPAPARDACSPWGRASRPACRTLRRSGRDRPRPHRRRRGGPCRLRLSVHRDRPGHYDQY